VKMPNKTTWLISLVTQGGLLTTVYLQLGAPATDRSSRHKHRCDQYIFCASVSAPRILNTLPKQLYQEKTLDVSFASWKARPDKHKTRQ
jgi:hypothetical protein